MLLAIDVGNTNAVFAIHDGKGFVAEWRCSSDYRRTADEYFVWLRKLMDHEGVTGTINEVIICSTVPRVVFNLRALRTDTSTAVLSWCVATRWTLAFLSA